MQRESLARGALALAIAGLLVKVSGLALRIPLTHMIKSEGIGIYQMALPAFYALFAFAAGGVPTAVNNMVAEYWTRGQYRTAERVLHLSLAFSTFAGGLATCVLLIGAPLLARALGDERSYWPLIAIAPAIYLYALDNCYRNYLQGRQIMTPSAVGSVLEQGARVVATLAAAYWLMDHGITFGAAGAALGMTVGAITSVLYMAAVYRRVRVREQAPGERSTPTYVLIRRMVALAWPITIGALILPLLSLLDVGIVQRGFQKAGYSVGEATAMYGYYQGIAAQVVWFPIILTNALAGALVPKLTGLKAAGQTGQLREKIVMAMRACGLVGLPAAVGVAVLAHPIALLFGEPAAWVPLLWLAPIAYLGPLFWMMAGVLQGLGRTGIPLRNFGLAMALKLALDFLLAPIPGVDIRGVAGASVVWFLVACWLNARSLERELDFSLPWSRLLVGPLLASVAMGGALLGLFASGLTPAGMWGRLAYALTLAPVLYTLILVVTRTVTWEDIRMMGGPIAPRLERLWNLLRFW